MCQPACGRMVPLAQTWLRLLPGLKVAVPPPSGGFAYGRLSSRVRPPRHVDPLCPASEPHLLGSPFPGDPQPFLVTPASWGSLGRAGSPVRPHLIPSHSAASLCARRSMITPLILRVLICRVGLIAYHALSSIFRRNQKAQSKDECIARQLLECGGHAGSSGFALIRGQASPLGSASTGPSVKPRPFLGAAKGCWNCRSLEQNTGVAP